jgi:hypothetical protein
MNPEPGTSKQPGNQSASAVIVWTAHGRTLARVLSSVDVAFSGSS